MLNIHSAILNPPLVPMTIYGGISSYSIAFNRQEDFTFHGRCASMDASMDDTARGWRWVALGGALMAFTRALLPFSLGRRRIVCR